MYGGGVRVLATQYPAADRDQTMLDAGQPQAANKADNALEALVDIAFEILVENATEEVGFAPREVYEAVFKLAAMKADHALAVEGLDYSQLKPSPGRSLTSLASKVPPIACLPCTPPRF